MVPTRPAPSPRWLGLSAVAALALATGEAIGGPWDERVHTQAHVATDKPPYRPGEGAGGGTGLWAAGAGRPEAWVRARVEVVGPDGATVWQQSVDGEDSALGCGWRVPP